MSQESKILTLLKAGRKLTPLTALRAGCGLRLSGRIYDLRQQGYNIKRTMVKRNGAVVAQYEMGG